MDKKALLAIFGNNLRAERNRQNLSQEKLAEKAGIMMSQISRIESGKTDLRLSTLVPILKALNLEFEKLYKFD
uniref:helix-turn-helix domain-containing protein n=1 Tax=Candidatus Scatousia sp. TaxID=3085663 RepID=UPI004027DE88